MGFVSAYGSVTVNTNATLIAASNPARKGCVIVNNGGASIFLGMDSGVTTSNGLPVASNATFSNSNLEAAWRGDIYGIIGSNSADVRFWEWGP